MSKTPMTETQREHAWETRRKKYGMRGRRSPQPPNLKRLESAERADQNSPWSWLRWQLGISQGAMSDLLGTSRNAVYLWESGDHLPGLRAYVAMCRLAAEYGLERSFSHRLMAHVKDTPHTKVAREAYVRDRRIKEGRVA